MKRLLMTVASANVEVCDNQGQPISQYRKPIDCFRVMMVKVGIDKYLTSMLIYHTYCGDFILDFTEEQETDVQNKLQDLQVLCANNFVITIKSR